MGLWLILIKETLRLVPTLYAQKQKTLAKHFHYYEDIRNSWWSLLGWHAL